MALFLGFNQLLRHVGLYRTLKIVCPGWACHQIAERRLLGEAEQVDLPCVNLLADVFGGRAYQVEEERLGAERLAATDSSSQTGVSLPVRSSALLGRANGLLLEAVSIA